MNRPKCPGTEIICPNCNGTISCHSCNNGVIYHCCGGKSVCPYCKQKYHCELCESIPSCNRCTSRVNNQLGTLYDIINNPKYYSSISYRSNDKISEVLITHNVLSTDFAKMVRDFIQAIPIDSNINKDSTNNDICTSIYDNLNINNFESNFISSEKDSWGWESYSYGIFRLYPRTFDAFMTSPIYKLFQVLRCKFANTRVLTQIYYPSTWVIQYMQPGTYIGAHSDQFPGRRLSFIYYLTPDDWDYKNDGGELIISRCPYSNIQTINDKLRSGFVPRTDTIELNPEFNSMVLWKIDPNADGNIDPLLASPVHYTNIPKRQGRIALVGFYNS